MNESTNKPDFWLQFTRTVFFCHLLEDVAEGDQRESMFMWIQPQIED